MEKHIDLNKIEAINFLLDHTADLNDSNIHEHIENLKFGIIEAQLLKIELQGKFSKQRMQYLIDNISIVLQSLINIETEYKKLYQETQENGQTPTDENL